jgi:4-amino-4-deoxy-L-arabinose transferase-like glycosyltransferase
MSVVVSAAEATTTAAAASGDDRAPRSAWVIAAIFTALELAVSDRFGFQQDELYFLVASHHLAFGYVDQPPLAVLMARTTDIVGVNPAAIRIIPAFAGGAVVVLAARLAALFGAGRTGRMLAALGTACAPVLLAAVHIANTTPYDLLAWAVVTWCVATAVLRDRPRWWLGAGLAAGLGLENEYLVVLLVLTLVVGILATSAHRRVLATPWPWIGGVIALAIWMPNLVWQFANGWPQLTMASALHQQNTSASDYIAGLPEQLLDAGFPGIPLVVAGLIHLWRSAELRFLAVAVTLVALYVLAWVPGKVYYVDGMLPVVLAAGAVPAERWLTTGPHRRRRWWVLGVVAVVFGVIDLLTALPVTPLSAVHKTPATANVTDSIGWPQLTADVAAQDRALTRAGTSPTSVYTLAYGEAAALGTYGGHDGLPPVISAHNSFWTWGPGNASDRTVLVVDALDQVRPYFASCRVLAVYNPPDQVKNDWTDIAISVCTGPRASWRALWPRLKHYD